MLNKTPIDISFAQGLDQKTDPKRIPMGKFKALNNMVFGKTGLLQKRNGFGSLLPQSLDSTYKYLTTFGGALTAIGKQFATYGGINAANWVTHGYIQPVSISTAASVRNNFTQINCDSAYDPTTGLVCTAYQETNDTATVPKYVITNPDGETIVAPTYIPDYASGVTGGMRVFVLNGNFVIVHTLTSGGTSSLKYTKIACADPSAGPSVPATICAAYSPASTLSWDGAVCSTNNRLYIAVNVASPSQVINVYYLNSSFALSGPTAISGKYASLMSVCCDQTFGTSPYIYVTYYSTSNAVNTGYSSAFDADLTAVGGPTAITAGTGIGNITSVASNKTCTIFLEGKTNYTYDSSIPSYNVSSLPLILVPNVSYTEPGGYAKTVIRSLGLASKAFYVGSDIYFWGAYKSTYQNTYFLIPSYSAESAPVVLAKLAYSNGGGYLATGLPGVTVSGTTAYFSYLYKDLITSVNKGTALSSTTQTVGIYSQTGVNHASLNFAPTMSSVEIGKNLNISGGILWMYDGSQAVENNFLLWPDTDYAAGHPEYMAAWSDTGGSMAAKPDSATNANAYYYIFVYEWTDNQGNIFRSAPSIPIAVATTNSGTSGSVALKIPTLRITNKGITNKIKINVYRWSVKNQIYYQTTNLPGGTALWNSFTSDSVSWTDIYSDASILGGNILYTTGGVVENISPPGTNAMTAWDSRIWLINAEDPDQLWFSKQIIEATPVEMSDLLTLYVSPSIGSQGPTGPMRSLWVMDDKLIIFKKNAIYYINGSGPDNTGSNSGYSQPTFVNATVGCSNQNSIVFQPQGLMFQSDKGIWLLGRDLSTSYIGAPVEDSVLGHTVVSAQNIPGTNQVRFMMDTGVVCVYDFFYDQWATFGTLSAVSSCIYNDLHAYMNSSGYVFQETVATYLDGSTPTVISFTTGPIRLGDLQNYQRAYALYLMGTYISPHTLTVAITYDHDTTASQTSTLSPGNYVAGLGTVSLEQFRLFLKQQRCQALTITVTEVYDSSKGLSAGAGLTLSGINVLAGFKGKFPTLPAAQSFG